MEKDFAIKFSYEVDEKAYVSLKGLIKRNGGNFKSQAQAKFIRRWETHDIAPSSWEIELKEGEYVIFIEAFFLFGQYLTGRGRVRSPQIFVMDQHGIRAHYQLKMERTYYTRPDGSTGVDGSYPVGSKLKWERSEVTFFPEVKEEIKPTVESKEFGVVGSRYALYNIYLRKVIHVGDQYGDKFIHLFTHDSFTFKWATRKLLDEGKYYNMIACIKGHEEYRGVKQTIITRPTKIIEVE